MKYALSLPVAVTTSALLLGSCAGPALFGQSSWPPDGGSEAGYAARDTGPARLPNRSSEGFLSRQGVDIDPRLPRDPNAPIGIDIGDEIASAPASAQGTGLPTTTGDASLHAWDGGVVAGPGVGVVAEVGTPTHGLEPSGAGRMHILELYQQRIDERDALVEEVDDLRALVRKLEQQLDGSRSGSADQTLQIAVLQAERDRLQRENAELAGRLTTAQIRRLEAEKILLESRIAHERAKVGVETTGTATTSSSGIPAPAGKSESAGSGSVARDGR